MSFIRAVLVLFVAGLLASAARADDSGSDLRLVVIVSRHGVRPPLAQDAVAAKQAAQPWPKWEVPSDFLTPHGAQALTLFGAYDRALYVREGLLTGNTATDVPQVFFRADNDERTIESSRSLGAGLLPGARPDIHSPPAGRIDPFFRPVLVPLGHPDQALANEAVLGRIGHDIPAVVRAHQGACDLLQRVLFGDTGVAGPGKTSPLAKEAWVGHTRGSDSVVSIDPFHQCMTLTEDFMLEYENGKPMEDVGWGRVTPGGLTQLLELHALYWDLAERTFYVAQVQGSNLAAHISRTLDQAVTGQAEPGAIGGPADRLVVVMGHDTNQINLSGLLGITWSMPGTQMNPVLPGGELVFELRQRRSDRQFFVRIRYVSQTMDQLRNLQALTLEHPPFTAPIFIPGCSEAGPGSDAPYGKFKALMDRVIDKQFTDL